MSRSFACLCAASLAMVLGAAGGASSQSTFFDPPPDEAGNHDPAGVYPQGQIFPLSFYSLLQADMAAARDANVPITGPYYGGVSTANLAAQDMAAAIGLRFVHQIEPANVTFQDSSPERLTTLSAAKKVEIRDQIRQQMASTLTSPGRNQSLYAWSLTPEELRPFRSVEMEYLQYVADTIRSTDQEYGNVPRPVFLYNPNNRQTSALVTLGAHLDILLKGAYVNSWPAAGSSAEAGQPRPWIRWAVDNIVSAAGTLPHRPTPFVTLEMSQDPPNAIERQPDTIGRWVRHGAYLSLVRGARGIFIWSGFRNRATLRQTFDFWFDAYRSVAADLNGANQLGKVFLFGQRRTDIGVTVTNGPASVSYQGSDGIPQTDTTVQFADIAYRAARYLVAVNSAGATVTTRFSGFPDIDVGSVQVFDGRTERIRGVFEYTFQPYEAVAWRFEPTPP